MDLAKVCPECGFTPNTKTTEAARTALGTHMHRKHGITPDGEPRPCTHKTVRHAHGDVQRYMSDGCRCARCRAALREARARTRRARAYGTFDRTHVDPSRTLEHIQHLRDGGLPVRAIAERAGLSEASIDKMLQRARRGRLASVHARTEAAILAVRPGVEHARYTPATGTARRLQALIAIGYGIEDLSRRVRVNRSAVTAIITGDAALVRHTTAAAAEAVYAELWDRPNIPKPRYARAAATRARRLAEASGWAPPLAWEDDEIDNPSAEPIWGEMANASARRRQILEDADWLYRSGTPAAEAARRIGVTAATIAMYARSAGRADIARWMEYVTRKAAS
jgi:transposase